MNRETKEGKRIRRPWRAEESAGWSCEVCVFIMLACDDAVLLELSDVCRQDVVITMETTYCAAVYFNRPSVHHTNINTQTSPSHPDASVSSYIMTASEHTAFQGC